MHSTGRNTSASASQRLLPGAGPERDFAGGTGKGAQSSPHPASNALKLSFLTHDMCLRDKV